MYTGLHRGSASGRATLGDKSFGPRKSSLLLPPGWSVAAGTNLPNGRDLPEGWNAIYQSSHVSFHITGLVSLQLFPSARPTPTRPFMFSDKRQFYTRITPHPNRGPFLMQRADLKECIYFLFLLMSDISVTPLFISARCFAMGGREWVGGRTLS